MRLLIKYYNFWWKILNQNKAQTLSYKSNLYVQLELSTFKKLSQKLFFSKIRKVKPRVRLKWLKAPIFIVLRWIRKDKRVTHVKLRQIKHFWVKIMSTLSKRIISIQLSIGRTTKTSQIRFQSHFCQTSIWAITISIWQQGNNIKVNYFKA